jgi:hypothetical protein
MKRPNDYACEQKLKHVQRLLLNLVHSNNNEPVMASMAHENATAYLQNEKLL